MIFSVHVQAAQQQRLSMSSTLSLALRRQGNAAEGSTLHLPPPAMSGEETSKYHPAPSRSEVAVVQPVLVSTFFRWPRLYSDALIYSLLVVKTHRRRPPHSHRLYSFRSAHSFKSGYDKSLGPAACAPSASYETKNPRA